MRGSQGKRVVLPLCGGNVDTAMIGRVLERGLAADGRLVKFSVAVPGSLPTYTRLCGGW